MVRHQSEKLTIVGSIPMVSTCYQLCLGNVFILLRSRGVAVLACLISKRSRGSNPASATKKGDNMKQIFMVLLLVFVSGCVPKKRQLEEPSYDVVCIDGVVYF